MSLGNVLRHLLLYQEPDNDAPFVLLEDSSEHGVPEAQKKSDPESGIRGKIYRLLGGAPKEKGRGPKPQVSTKLDSNLERLKQEFGLPTNQDVVIREFRIQEKVDAFLVYVEGLVDQRIITEAVLLPLQHDRSGSSEAKGQELLNHLANDLLATNQIKLVAEFEQAITWILAGKTALFVAGCRECILIETTKFEKRAVHTPQKEMVVHGPQEGYVEDLRTNITLVRRILRNKNLITETIRVNETNNLDCALLYVQDIANPKLVAEAKRRLTNINQDFIFGGAINQYIEDHPFAILPTILNTERPDRTAALLMDGRLAIILEGTPSASIVPVTFFHLFHSIEDYTLRWPYGGFLRAVRLIATFFAVFLPGLYLALTLYHHESIPAGLLDSIIQSRENLPFPAATELVIMETSWELIREAGVRVPGVVGQTLGIIGGVILGQAAVQAGLVSPILIIVVAITGLGNFAIPNFSAGFAARLFRFVFLFLGGIGGFYGIATGVCVLGGLACSMKSFGVPFFSPLAPTTKARSMIMRAPLWKDKRRADPVNPRKRLMTQDKVRGWRHQKGEGRDSE